MSSALATWSRVLMIVLWVLVGLATVALGYAGLMIVVDEASHADDWDGFGTIFGLIFGGGALIMLLILVPLALLTRSGRRRSSRRRILVAATLSLLPAGAFLFWAYALAVDDWDGFGTVATVALPALSLLIPAAATLVALGMEARDHAPV